MMNLVKVLSNSNARNASITHLADDAIFNHASESKVSVTVNLRWQETSMTKLPKTSSTEELSRSMGADKSGDRQTVIKLVVGGQSPKAQSAVTFRRPPSGRESFIGSEMLLLPLGACRTLELCAGAVSFRLDCAEAQSLHRHFHLCGV